jgi:hypothetical protein
MKCKIHFDGTRDESVVFQFLQDIQDQMELAITPEIDVVRGMKIYKTYNRIKQLCTWPKMKSDIGRYIARCRVCATVKPEQRFPPGTMGMRHDIQRPWQMISCDLFGPLPRSGNGNEYVLVITDYFSKFPFFTRLRQVRSGQVGVR